MIAGPSHAGKTTLLRGLLKTPADWSGLRTRLIELDLELGQNRRGDGDAAVTYLRSLRHSPSSHDLYLVDVGAGQMMSRTFRDYFVDRDDRFRWPVVVWCNRETFVGRHSEATAQREWSNNFSPELAKVWNVARIDGYLIDTSAPVTVAESRHALVDMVRRIVAKCAV